MAEFKKLSEVEKLETASDEANVLIEEGGEVKRVPKKEVGGGGEEMDIVLTVNNRLGAFIVLNEVAVTEGSTDAVLASFKEGRVPKGKVVFYQDNSNEYGTYGTYGNHIELPATFYFYGGEVWIGCVGLNPYVGGNMYGYRFRVESGSIVSVENFYFSGNYME